MGISSEKFKANLISLKAKLPKKPIEYTSEYPKTLKECLTLYCNQRTVHLLQINTILLNQYNWPLPLWYDTEKFKFGFCNRIYLNIFKGKKIFSKKDKGFTYISNLMILKLIFKLEPDKIILEAFDANKKNAFKKLKTNPILSNKLNIINSIKKSYLNKNYIACINTILPLVDFVSRKLLNSSRLTDDVKKIINLFKDNGISIENSEDLMPFMKSIVESKPFKSEELKEILEKFDFGIIGCALSSFIKFASTYYSFYKEEKSSDDQDLLNRHAILHGSSSNYGTKENTVKLLTFLFLLLELEEIFKILLDENH